MNMNFRWPILLIATLFVVGILLIKFVAWSPVPEPTPSPLAVAHSPKVADILNQLADDYAQNGHAAIVDFQSRFPFVAIDSQERIQVFLYGQPDKSLELSPEVQRTFNVKVVISSGDVIQAFVPIQQFDRLASASDSIWSIGLPPQPIAQ